MLWHGVSCLHPSRSTSELTVTHSCTLFWKAFGIVVLGIVLWQSAKLIMWAVKVLHFQSPSLFVC